MALLWFGSGCVTLSQLFKQRVTTIANKRFLNQKSMSCVWYEKLKVLEQMSTHESFQTKVFSYP